jgi:hypothetical protein
MDPQSSPPKPGEITSFWVLGARLTWIIAGPVALVGITYGIVSGGTGWLTGLDAAFGVVAGLMLLGRWAEQRSGSAITLTGEPATPEQLKRYVTILIPVTAAIWVIANIVGNHVLD